MLPEGTVTFDELSSTIYVGRIIQPSSKASPIGSLIFDYNDDNLVELQFTEHDRIAEAGKYTLLEGDFVQFRIAFDKRQTTKRATQISLIEEHSLSANSQNTKEHRERGILVKLLSANDLMHLNQLNVNNVSSGASGDYYSKISYGAIKCVEQDEIVYFSFNELVNYVKFTSSKAAKNNAGEENESIKSSQHQEATPTISYKVNQVKLEVGDSLEFSVVQTGLNQNVLVIFFSSFFT